MYMELLFHGKRNYLWMPQKPINASRKLKYNQFLYLLLLNLNIILKNEFTQSNVLHTQS